MANIRIHVHFNTRFDKVKALFMNINMNLKDREVDRTHEICLCQSEENSYTAKRIQVPPNMTEQEYTKTTLMKDALYDEKV